MTQNELCEKVYGHPTFVGWTTEGYRFYYCECATLWRVRGDTEEIMNLDGDVVDRGPLGHGSGVAGGAEGERPDR